MLLPRLEVAELQYYFFPHTPWIRHGVCCPIHYGYYAYFCDVVVCFAFCGVLCFKSFCISG